MTSRFYNVNIFNNVKQPRRIYYNPFLKEKARQLRNDSTLSEILLWKELKGRKFKGYDFHRQKPIDNYIVDFFCFELMLAIEIDGISHIFKEDRDEKRLEELGVRLLRFDDLLVKRDLDGVLKSIMNWIVKNR